MKLYSDGINHSRNISANVMVDAPLISHRPTARKSPPRDTVHSSTNSAQLFVSSPRYYPTAVCFDIPAKKSREMGFISFSLSARRARASQARILSLLLFFTPGFRFFQKKTFKIKVFVYLHTNQAN
ncbi:hypothetical protein QQF64_013162 [Cirrhinus molitorella]|uniref:Uncharacterized protein n=1 Tax=Cirrhinus molitorella TaxID=172907 RepID=A0ABR3LSX6_9TELE